MFRMPIDFIKVSSRELDVSALLHNDRLHFKSEFSHRTAELYPTKVAKYKGLEFTVFDQFFRMQGSLHKFKNNGKHNFDDFKYSEMVEVIGEIEDLLSTSSEKIRLENIEFGVNILPQFETSKILQNLICSGTTEFGNVALKSGYCKKAILNDFQLKGYNKAQQHALAYELFRWEVHVNKMRQTKGTGIQTLEDLKNKDKLIMLQPILIEAWNKVLLFDWTIDEVKGKETVGAEQFYKMQLFSFWNSLNNKQRYKQRKRYEQRLVYPHSQKVQEQIGKQISEKFDFLINS